ncbi:hypothetical protein [Paraburkholderia fynbosensis]|uniref:Uncharacterized protein n=1 Tax=Paraburkholderia fynbosensis TaxID=1200993 RepID=A0A6J5GU23_9BURK|nr:hypothetical protein [Paraburkholderia fynbosensis]CAB3805767.1 hypothetical protein LMG27177_05928 [Paraburkholderia fynbosensis]
MCGNPQLGELIDKYQLPAFVIQLRQTVGADQMIGNSLAEHEDSWACGVVACLVVSGMLSSPVEYYPVS